MTDFTGRLAALRSEPSRDSRRDPARLARVERTRAEMMGQGAAISRTLTEEAPAVASLARTLVGRGFDRVVIVGCGDSWFTAMAVRLGWEALLGVPVEAAQALDYAAYGSGTANGRTLAIGLSAGGNTPAVIAALGAARLRGAATVGVSNTRGSPVLAQSDAGLLVHATRAGWPTQSTTAAIALLLRLAAAVAEMQGRDVAAFLDALRRVPDMLDGTAAGLDADIAGIARPLAAAPLVLFTGLGPNFAAAALGAAKVRELSPVHAIAMPLEEMHHYRLPKHGDPLVIVATDPASRERALDTALVSHAVGAHAIAVLSRPDADIAAHVRHVVLVPAVPDPFTALVASVPMHLFAYHFAKAHAAEPGAT